MEEIRELPGGIEWPRYESGELVEIGDEVVGPDYGEQFKVSSVEFHANGFTLHDKNGFSKWYESDDRFERHAVLAADGETLDVGQTVWEVDGTGHAFEVVGIRPDTGRAMEPTVVTCDVGDGTSEHFLPSQLTHQRPVLDADGVPIREGDTVYLLPGEWCGEYPLRDYSAGDEMVVKELYSDHEFEGVLRCAGDGKCVCFPLPCQLTHTKPEPDSWSSVWADVSNGNETPEGMMRRCRALAERGE